MRAANLIVSIPVLTLLLGCGRNKNVDPLVASIDSIMTSVVDTARFNGNVLFARNGKVIYQKSFGWANFDTKEPLNDSSMFDLASVSKQFTAMGIMMLKEQGKLSYDDDVRKYLPELPYEGITIRHFLTHTSGIAGYMDPERPMGWDPNKIHLNEDILSAYVSQKPPGYFQPGEKWVYSNGAYIFLAIIIERVSGTSYAQFLKENVFIPLGMSRSRIYSTRRSGETINNYAYGFVYIDSLETFMLPDSLPALQIVYTMDGVEGDGSVNSTTPDLFRWNEALFTERLVSQSTLEEAFTPVLMSDGATYPYGFGWRIEKDSILGKWVRHTGGWPGYYSHIRRYLDSKDCLVILSNNGGLGRQTIFTELEKRLRKQELLD